MFEEQSFRELPWLGFSKFSKDVYCCYDFRTVFIRTNTYQIWCKTSNDFKNSSYTKLHAESNLFGEQGNLEIHEKYQYHL